MSCLQSAQLGTPQKVQLYLLRGRARMAVGDIAKAREGALAAHSYYPVTSYNAWKNSYPDLSDLYRVLDLVPDHSVATSLLSIPQSASTSSKDVCCDFSLFYFPLFSFLDSLRLAEDSSQLWALLCFWTPIFSCIMATCGLTWSAYYGPRSLVRLLSRQLLGSALITPDSFVLPWMDDVSAWSV